MNLGEQAAERGGEEPSRERDAGAKVTEVTAGKGVPDDGREGTQAGQQRQTSVRRQSVNKLAVVSGHPVERARQRGARGPEHWQRRPAAHPRVRRSHPRLGPRAAGTPRGAARPAAVREPRATTQPDLKRSWSFFSVLFSLNSVNAVERGTPRVQHGSRVPRDLSHPRPSACASGAGQRPPQYRASRTCPAHPLHRDLFTCWTPEFSHALPPPCRGGQHCRSPPMARRAAADGGGPPAAGRPPPRWGSRGRFLPAGNGKGGRRSPLACWPPRRRSRSRGFAAVCGGHPFPTAGGAAAAGSCRAPPSPPAAFPPVAPSSPHLATCRRSPWR